MIYYLKMGTKFSSEREENIVIDEKYDLNNKFAWFKTKNKYIFYVENKRLEFDLKRTEAFVINYTGSFEEFLNEQKNQEMIVQTGDNFDINLSTIKGNWINIIGRNSSGIIQIFRLWEFENIIEDFAFNNLKLDLLYSPLKNINGYYLRLKHNKVCYDYINFPDLRFKNCVIKSPDFIDKNSGVCVGSYYYEQKFGATNSYGYYLYKNVNHFDNYMDNSKWNSLINIEFTISPVDKILNLKDKIIWKNIKKLRVFNIKDLPENNLHPLSLPPPINPEKECEYRQEDIPIAVPLENIK